MSKPERGPWIGFLVMAFAVVGLVGTLGVYAAQIPFDRALARNATLDRVLAMAGDPNAAAKLVALRPALGDSADHVLAGGGDLHARVAAERARMLAAFGTESADIGLRLRVVIIVFAAAGALFGVAILSIVGRAPTESRGRAGGLPPGLP